MSQQESNGNLPNALPKAEPTENSKPMWDPSVRPLDSAKQSLPDRVNNEAAKILQLESQKDQLTKYVDSRSEKISFLEEQVKKLRLKVINQRTTILSLEKQRSKEQPSKIKNQNLEADLVRAKNLVRTQTGLMKFQTTEINKLVAQINILVNQKTNLAQIKTQAEQIKTQAEQIKTQAEQIKNLGDQIMYRGEQIKNEATQITDLVAQIMNRNQVGEMYKQVTQETMLTNNQFAQMKIQATQVNNKIVPINDPAALIKNSTTTEARKNMEKLIPAVSSEASHLPYAQSYVTHMRGGSILEGSDTAEHNLAAFAFEKKVCEVLDGHSVTSRDIMQRYEEMGQTLPALRPAFRAALAAMPPATKALCVARVSEFLPNPSDIMALIKDWRVNDEVTKNEAARMAVFWGHLTARQIAALDTASPTTIAAQWIYPFKPMVHSAATQSLSAAADTAPVRKHTADGGAAVVEGQKSSTSSHILHCPPANQVYGPKLPPSLLKKSLRKRPAQGDVDLTKENSETPGTGDISVKIEGNSKMRIRDSTLLPCHTVE